MAVDEHEVLILEIERLKADLANETKKREELEKTVHANCIVLSRLSERLTLFNLAQAVYTTIAAVVAGVLKGQL